MNSTPTPRPIRYGPITNSTNLAAHYFQTEASKICNTRFGVYLFTKDDILISANGWPVPDDLSVITESKDLILEDVLTVDAKTAQELQLTVGESIENFEIFIAQAYDTESPMLQKMKQGDFSDYKQRLILEMK